MLHTFRYRNPTQVPIQLSYFPKKNINVVMSHVKTFLFSKYPSPTMPLYVLTPQCPPIKSLDYMECPTIKSHNGMASFQPWLTIFGRIDTSQQMNTS